MMDAALAIRDSIQPRDPVERVAKDAMEAVYLATQSAAATLGHALVQIEADVRQQMDAVREEELAHLRTEMQEQLAEAEASRERLRQQSIADMAATFESHRTTVVAVQTWVDNAPVPPDPVMWASMVTDGTMANWFGSYCNWLRHRGLRL